jgi:hypothetical protein
MCVWGIEGFERELYEQLKMLDPNYAAQQSAEAQAFHERWKKIGADSLKGVPASAPPAAPVSRDNKGSSLASVKRGYSRMPVPE